MILASTQGESDASADELSGCVNAIMPRQSYQDSQSTTTLTDVHVVLYPCDHASGGFNVALSLVMDDGVIG